MAARHKPRISQETAVPSDWVLPCLVQDSRLITYLPLSIPGKMQGPQQKALREEAIARIDQILNMLRGHNNIVVSSRNSSRGATIANALELAKARLGRNNTNSAARLIEQVHKQLVDDVLKLQASSARRRWTDFNRTRTKNFTPEMQKASRRLGRDLYEMDSAETDIRGIIASIKDETQELERLASASNPKLMKEIVTELLQDLATLNKSGKIGSRYANQIGKVVNQANVLLDLILNDDGGADLSDGTIMNVDTLVTALRRVLSQLEPGTKNRTRRSTGTAPRSMAGPSPKASTSKPPGASHRTR